MDTGALVVPTTLPYASEAAAAQRTADPQVSRQTQVNWISTVAHELRSPLSALLATSEILDTDLEDLDRQQVRAAVTAIRRGATWLQGMTENLLSAAAISERQFRLAPSTISLLETIDEARGIVGPIVRSRAQPLRILSRGTVPMVWADRRRICQILINLITNSSKYSPAGTTIDIIVRPRQDRVRVGVADRGPGIPTGYSDRVFDPSFRLPGDVAAGTTGYGLGLAIVRSLTAAHGSPARAKRRRGGGTTIQFELRTAASHARDEGEPA